MAETDLENKIKNAINNIIVALKAKGEKQISTKKIVNFIADKYDVVLDDDYVANILSKSPAVSEINNDKISIGKAPNDDENAVQNELNNASLSSPSVDIGMGGDMGGSPMDSNLETTDGEVDDTITPDEEEMQDMEDSIDELKIESLQLGDIINIKNKQLDNIINEHILYTCRKNNINLKVKKINENGIFCSPEKGVTSILVKMKI